MCYEMGMCLEVEILFKELWMSSLVFLRSSNGDDMESQWPYLSRWALRSISKYLHENYQLFVKSSLKVELDTTRNPP